MAFVAVAKKVNVNVKDTYYLLTEPYDRVMQLNIVY